MTLAGPRPALLNRLRGGGQAQLSAALGAHCLDKPGGLEAQLKLGQRGLASSLRWREIPRVLQCCWPQRHEKEEEGGGGRGGQEVEVRGQRPLLLRASVCKTLKPGLKTRGAVTVDERK